MSTRNGIQRGADWASSDSSAGAGSRDPSNWVFGLLRELWRYRELTYFLALRDVQIRYKQAILGMAWAVLQPFLAMVVFTLFFGKLAKMDSEGLPYAVFSYVGLLPWTFFANTVAQSSNSLVGATNLIKKVYFPRVIIPISAILAGLVDFAVSLLLLFALMGYYGVVPTAKILFIPLLLALAFISSLGLGLWLSALNVEYRDVRFVVPFMVQMWLFATPVIYPARKVTEKLAEIGLPGWLYGLNPMVGVVEGFRWACLDGKDVSASLLWTGLLVALLVLASGVAFFRRMERTFADII